MSRGSAARGMRTLGLLVHRRRLLVRPPPSYYTGTIFPRTFARTYYTHPRTRCVLPIDDEIVEQAGGELEPNNQIYLSTGSPERSQEPMPPRRL